jgi:hypothetical protein
MKPIEEISKFIELTDAQIEEIQNGAHVILKDDGHLYDKFLAYGQTRCYCQHQSHKKVYDIEASTGNVLVGFLQGTWLQWERSTPYSLSHVVDLFKYIFTYKNQGPFGESELTDKSPMILTNSRIEF